MKIGSCEYRRSETRRSQYLLVFIWVGKYARFKLEYDEEIVLKYKQHNFRRLILSRIASLIIQLFESNWLMISNEDGKDKLCWIWSLRANVPQPLPPLMTLLLLTLYSKISDFWNKNSEFCPADHQYGGDDVSDSVGVYTWIYNKKSTIKKIDRNIWNPAVVLFVCTCIVPQT